MQIYVYFGKCTTPIEIIFGGIKASLSKNKKLIKERLNNLKNDYKQSLIEPLFYRISTPYIIKGKEYILQCVQLGEKKVNFRTNEVKYFFTIDDAFCKIYKFIDDRFCLFSNLDGSIFLLGERVTKFPCNRSDIEKAAWKNLRNKEVWMVYADWLQEIGEVEFGTNLMNMFFSLY
jgi:hypothetical protein